MVSSQLSELFIFVECKAAFVSLRILLYAAQYFVVHFDALPTATVQSGGELVSMGDQFRCIRFPLADLRQDVDAVSYSAAVLGCRRIR